MWMHNAGIGDGNGDGDGRGDGNGSGFVFDFAVTRAEAGMGAAGYPPEESWSVARTM